MENRKEYICRSWITKEGNYYRYEGCKSEGRITKSDHTEVRRLLYETEGFTERA